MEKVLLPHKVAYPLTQVDVISATKKWLLESSLGLGLTGKRKMSIVEISMQ